MGDDTSSPLNNVITIVLKRSWAGEVRNVSLLVAIGVNSDGYRAGWSAFLKHLKERGLSGIRLIISDACLGLAESAAEFFPDAAWQRCVVHWYRNIFSHVPSTKVREIAAMLKAIHAGEDIVAAREKAIRVIEKLRDSRLIGAAELVETAVEETLTYYGFPEEHWRRIPDQQSTFFFVECTSVAKFVGNIGQHATQNFIAAPSLKAPMYGFVVRIALRQHVPTAHRW